MPYIKQENRDELSEAYESLKKALDNIGYTGNLNYILYRLAKYSCKNYRHYRDFIGELESAKLEIYRRLVSKYEDDAIERNGDVE